MSSESAQYHVVASPVYSHGDAATSTSMVSKDPGTPRFSERYLLPILYLTIFLFLYGENIQPAPRTQIYELVICRRLHGGDENIVLDANICKSPDVQEELAFLKGMERLLGIFPTVLAIPYSLLADRYGRSVVFTLALLGLFFEELWNFLVCWFSSIIPIRLVLLGPFFELVGGGPAVFTTMLFVIAADTVSDQDRSNTFLRLQATGIAAAITAQISSSLLMSLNVWMPWFLGILALLAATATATIVPNWPKKQSDLETPILGAGLAVVNSPVSANSILPEIEGSNTLRAHFVDAIKSLRAGIFIILGNGQLMLLLWASFLARLGADSIAMMLLLYISKRFTWDFGKANLFLALGDSVQFLFLIILLPYLSNVLLSRYHMASYTKDLRIAITSMMILSIGCLLLGFGPQIWVAAMGVILTSAAGGLQPILRSLVTTSISAADISLVYSVFTILHVISNSLAGPLYSGTFTIGLNLGVWWTGLPFVVAGGLVALALAGLMFVKEKHTYDMVPADDLDA